MSDAKDLAKGGLLGLLRGAGALCGPKVVSMFTRLEPGPDYLRSYLALFGRGEGSVKVGRQSCPTPGK